MTQVSRRKDGRLCEWWCVVFAAYWSQFLWRLPIDVEPHNAMDVAEPHTGSEAEEQLATRLFTKPRIKSFFYHAHFEIRCWRVHAINMAAINQA
ncbi:hypothetical protein B0H13DRAFT_2376113 [Mycena leptocephala]|nr:hypothetical protein B0H13DRAFT_2376113 [Mycena leptocephala]